MRSNHPETVQWDRLKSIGPLYKTIYALHIGRLVVFFKWRVR